MVPFPSRSSFMSAAAAAAAIAAATPPVLAQQLTKLRVAGTHSDPFGEWLYAKEAGAFNRLGFEVEGNALANAGAVAAAIGGGSLEMGIGDLVSGINAINAGVPILLIAGAALYSSSDVGAIMLAVAKDSPIRAPRDLIGKTIGVPTLVGLTTAALRAWLPQNGVEVSQVKLIELPASTVVPALLRGIADCALLSEPFITPNKNDIRDIGKPLDAIAKEFLLSVWYASKPWVEADRDRARRAVQGIYETARWANSHRAETFGILVRDAKFDGDKLRGMARTTFATSLTPAMVQPVLNVAAQYKIFDRQLDANTLITRL
jgi:ABC-type nitrate/sulfonate/bicarbonate transport system substrate-binding protein